MTFEEARCEVKGADDTELDLSITEELFYLGIIEKAEWDWDFHGHIDDAIRRDIWRYSCEVCPG